MFAGFSGTVWLFDISKAPLQISKQQDSGSSTIIVEFRLIQSSTLMKVTFKTAMLDRQKLPLQIWKP